MKGAALFGILVVSILIMGGSFYYFHTQDQKILPKFSISLDFKDNSSFNASYLITLSGFNASYPITLSGVPSGNGTYQQLLTISDPLHYGINANGSNIAFYDGSNQTELYAWIQSINSTSIQVWVKNFNGSSTINMQVLPSFENLFSATGYLGESTGLSLSYNNFKQVFVPSEYYLNYSYTGQTIDSVNFFMGGVKSAYMPSLAFIQLNGACSSSQPNIYLANATHDGYSVWNVEGGLFSGSDIDEHVSDVNVSQADFMGVSILSSSTIFWQVNSEMMIQTYSVSSPSTYSLHGGGGINIDFSYLIFLNATSMPTFTIGSVYHPLSSFSISSNSLVVNTTFMEHNLTGYQYYAFSPVYNGNPVWFLVNGQIGDRLSVLLDGNVSLTVQILGYSYSNIIKEVKVE